MVMLMDGICGRSSGCKECAESHRKVSSKMRRSGIITVTENPPDISPELRMAVESRMQACSDSSSSTGDTPPLPQVIPPKLVPGITTGIPFARRSYPLPAYNYIPPLSKLPFGRPPLFRSPRLRASVNTFRRYFSDTTAPRQDFLGTTCRHAVDPYSVGHRRPSDSSGGDVDGTLCQQFQKLQSSGVNVESLQSSSAWRGSPITSMGTMLGIPSQVSPASSTCSLGASPTLHHGGISTGMPLSPSMTSGSHPSAHPQAPHMIISPTSSPIPSVTPPSIPGSPHHGVAALDATGVNMSQLYLQTAPSSSTSPRSPQHMQHSPPSSLSPQPSRLSPGSPMTRPVPSHLGLDCIKEEPSMKLLEHPPDRPSLAPQKPHITISDVSGDVVINSSSDSSPDISQEMYTSAVSSDATIHHAGSSPALYPGLAIDDPLPQPRNCDSRRPSITKGTGGHCLHSPGMDSDSVQWCHNEPNLARQSAVLIDCAATNRQMFISGSERYSSFPPFHAGAKYATFDEPEVLHLQSSQNVLISSLLKTDSGSLLLHLPNEWLEMPSQDLLSCIFQMVQMRVPYYLVQESLQGCGISVQDSTGAQVVLEVSEGCPPEQTRALKMRRVSGDESRYILICQQLLHCMMPVDIALGTA